MTPRSATSAPDVAAQFKVLAAMRRNVEQRPADFAGRLADILKVASYTTTERIDASHYAFGHVGRGPIYNRDDDDVWLEGLLEVGRDDDGLSVRWPAGFLLSPGTKGVAAEMTTVDTVIGSPDGELVFPMPNRLIVDWRPFRDQMDDDDDEPFGVSASIGDLIRNARGLKTTTGASLDDLVRMAGSVVFVDGGYGVHVAEDQVRGVVVSRRNSDMIADFTAKLHSADTLRMVLSAVVFHKVNPVGMSPEQADDLNWLDQHITLSGRGVLAAIDALQFVHRKLASARKALTENLPNPQLTGLR